MKTSRFKQRRKVSTAKNFSLLFSLLHFSLSPAISFFNTTNSEKDFPFFPFLPCAVDRDSPSLLKVKLKLTEVILALSPFLCALLMHCVARVRAWDLLKDIVNLNR